MAPLPLSPLPALESAPESSPEPLPESPPLAPPLLDDAAVLPSRAPPEPLASVPPGDASCGGDPLEEPHAGSTDAATNAMARTPPPLIRAPPPRLPYRPGPRRRQGRAL